MSDGQQGKSCALSLTGHPECGATQIRRKSDAEGHVLASGLAAAKQTFTAKCVLASRLSYFQHPRLSLIYKCFQYALS